MFFQLTLNLNEFTFSSYFEPTLVSSAITQLSHSVTKCEPKSGKYSSLLIYGVYVAIGDISKSTENQGI